MNKYAGFEDFSNILDLNIKTETEIEEPTVESAEKYLLVEIIESGLKHNDQTCEDGEDFSLDAHNVQTLCESSSVHLDPEHLMTSNREKIELEKGAEGINDVCPQTEVVFKAFHCALCTYKTNHKGTFNNHLLSHSDTKLYKCSDCSYECNYKGSLKRHLLTHSDIKLFKCPECSFECNRKGNLDRHFLSHSKRKLFKCSNCSHECSRKDDLQRHVLTHSNTKLFKCSECDYECNQRGNLSTHLMTHSNAKLFKCPQCSYECKQKSSLKRHALKHKVS